MIQGRELNEIRELPINHFTKIALHSVDSRLERHEISEENALDVCAKIVLDYKRNKEEIIRTINKKKKITILDAIMGSGKSTFLIDIINNHPENNYICVLPTLDECQRYAKAIQAKVFEPKRIRTKTIGLQQLIVSGKNIVTTHALIQNIDDFTMDLLQKSNYHLIIDECLDVVHPYEQNFKPSDFKSLLERNYVAIDQDKGFLIWNNQEQANYDGRYNDIKQLCSLNSLMCLRKDDGTWSDRILMWNFPISFFDLFEKCYIATYLFDGSIQKSYFQLHGIEYAHMTIKNGKLDIYSTEKEVDMRMKYFNMIDIYQGKLNEIGTPSKGSKKQPLTSTWYRNKARDEKGRVYLDLLKNNVANYFRHIVNSPSDENMYSVFKDYKKYIAGKGYSKGFVSCNAKATNDYRNKCCLAYLLNYHIHPNIVTFFDSNNVVVNQDLFSLSELLQWIWRSQIRDGKPIHLYLPSQRMRELLGLWALGKI